ncbi:hypothetical protein [Bradyrhizobium sp. ISRA463]|uniref:hypothetical protein n=1 Tax=Bradyrhizobium sp. ISRA463 TaxID=2866199 RepID=UPI002479E6BD|nr:hypothetical protein [Bradyrhizobium sp. ISRA463]WGS17320.1 hypothetical protein MTX22_21875 [Bradyrhizobium sp. ISRA463]
MRLPRPTCRSQNSPRPSRTKWRKGASNYAAAALALVSDTLKIRHFDMSKK